MKRKLILLCLFAFTGSIAEAQTKKIYTDPYIWTDLQLDYYLSRQSMIFFRSQFRHNTDSDFRGLSESGPLSKLYQIYLLAGYDHQFNDHWSASGFARYTFDATNDNMMFQGALRHLGKIGSVEFLKRLAYDYIKPEFGDSRGRFRPGAALERNFKIGNHILRSSLSYELFFYQDFKDNNSDVDSRTVDRTRLRLAVSYKVNRFLWITPYFMKQTEYYNVLPTYAPQLDANGKPVLDNDGNEIIVEKEAGGKRNLIQPVFGLDIRFLLPGSLNAETVPRLMSLGN